MSPSSGALPDVKNPDGAPQASYLSRTYRASLLSGAMAIPVYRSPRICMYVCALLIIFSFALYTHTQKEDLILYTCCFNIAHYNIAFASARLTVIE